MNVIVGGEFTAVKAASPFGFNSKTYPFESGSGPPPEPVPEYCGFIRAFAPFTSSSTATTVLAV